MNYDQKHALVMEFYAAEVEDLRSVLIDYIVIHVYKMRSLYKTVRKLLPKDFVIKPSSPVYKAGKRFIDVKSEFEYQLRPLTQYVPDSKLIEAKTTYDNELLKAAVDYYFSKMESRANADSFELPADFQGDAQ